MSENKPYRDKEWLREKYYGENMTLREMADLADCGQTTIITWMDKHNIERRDFGGYEKNAPYKDKDTLQELYHEKRMSVRQVADELDTNQGCIQYWLRNHEIERRGRLEKQIESPPSMFTSKQGYEMFSPDEDIVMVHHIVALLKDYDPDKVFSPDYHVHHETNIPWDNRPENLEIMTHSEHMERTQAARFRGEEYGHK